MRLVMLEMNAYAHRVLVVQLFSESLGPEEGRFIGVGSVCYPRPTGSRMVHCPS